MKTDLLIFDMDGVLVDVSESYRAAIQETVEHFTGQSVARETIQDYKNQGGWNDDFALSHRLILDHGVEMPYQEVVNHFQKIFHGNGSDGLILRERWLASDGLFDRLRQRFEMAVFTGRDRWEANVTLDRFLPGAMALVVGADDVERTKPAPDGIVEIRRKIPHERVWYVGDTVDDARSASAAGVPFIGIASPASPRYEELITVLSAEGPIAILDDINQLESALPL